ncbi:sensor histidine kinase [Glutamicibacter sp.]|uniref:sensor histidine kinase n=1 Tax=Glutamicibacter sp. TaxID=1931995 RepID=UPI002FE1BEFD
MRKWTAWTADIKPLPGGIAGRLVPVLLALVMYLGEVGLGSGQFTGQQGALKMALPYLPTAALSLGVLPAAIAWFLCVAGIATLGMPAVLIAGLIFSSVVVISACCYLLPWRQALSLPLLALALLFALCFLIPDVQVLTIVINAIFVAFAGTAGLSLNSFRRRHETSAKRIEALEIEQAKIRANERTLLAHELHDIVAHDVTIIAMQARRAEFVKDPEKTSEILAGIGSSAQQTLQDLRSLVLLLKESDKASEATIENASVGPSIIDPAELSGETTTAVGLVHDLDAVADALQSSGYDVDLTVEGEVARVPASLRQALRRTIREMGTNILKHAVPSSRVEMRLYVGESNVQLRATNEAGVEKPIMSSRTGLEAMRARCGVFGGFVEADESDGLWTTSVTIPLEGISTAN